MWSKRKEAFVESYLRCWIATQAAKDAGYSHKTAYAQGSRLLKDAEVRERIQGRLTELKMSADEVLVRLAAQARGDISMFIKQGGAINWDAVIAHGALVKKVKHNAGQNSEIEIHDSQSALKLIGQAHRLFVERHEVDANLNITGLDGMLNKVYGNSDDDDTG